MHLGLGSATHDTEADPGFAVSGNKCGDDRVEGSFPRRVAVGAARGEIEQLGPVLEHESQPIRYHPRTHSPEVALDQAHHVAFSVGHGQVDGVAVAQGLVAGLVAVGGALRINELPALAGIFLGNEGLDRHTRKGHIGVETGPVFKGQFLSLHEIVNAIGAAIAHGGDIVAFQDIKDLEGSDPLAVGGQFPDIVAAVVGGDRLHPLGGVGSQVFVREETVHLFHEVVDCAGDLALIESVPTFPGDQFQGVGQVGILKHLTFPGGAATGHVGLSVVWIIVEPPGGAFQVIGDQLRYREALPGIGDGRLEDLLHGKAPKAAMQLKPAVHRAGHADRKGAVAGDFTQPQLPEMLQGQGLWRPAAGIQAVELLRLAIPHNGEQVPADATAGGFHQAQGRVGRYGRVDGVTPLFQDIQGDLGGQGVACGCYPMLGNHFGPGGEGAAGDTVLT